MACRNDVRCLCDRQEWQERGEENSLIIERILILVRNVLNVPADPDAEKRPDNDVSAHDKASEYSYLYYYPPLHVIANIPTHIYVYIHTHYGITLSVDGNVKLPTVYLSLLCLPTL